MKNLKFKNGIRHCVALALLVSGAISHAQGVEVEVQLPDNAKLAWISNNLNQSGMDLSIRTFESPDSIDAVFDFYRKVWFREGDVPGFVENEMGEWSLISQLREDHNIVLQLKPGETGGSEGFLSIAEKNHGGSKRELDFPMPDGTELFSNTFVEEQDSEVDTMTFITNQDVSSAAAFYRDTLRRKGWELAREDTIKESEFLLFNRKGDRLEMVVTVMVDQGTPIDATVIYVNRVKRNG